MSEENFVHLAEIFDPAHYISIGESHQNNMWVIVSPFCDLSSSVMVGLFTLIPPWVVDHACQNSTLQMAYSFCWRWSYARTPGILKSWINMGFKSGEILWNNDSVLFLWQSLISRTSPSFQSVLDVFLHVVIKLNALRKPAQLPTSELIDGVLTSATKVDPTISPTHPPSSNGNSEWVSFPPQEAEVPDSLPHQELQCRPTLLASGQSHVVVVRDGQCFSWGIAHKAVWVLSCQLLASDYVDVLHASSWSHSLFSCAHCNISIPFQFYSVFCGISYQSEPSCWLINAVR